jgi:hypothetical protein
MPDGPSAISGGHNAQLTTKACFSAARRRLQRAARWRNHVDRGIHFDPWRFAPRPPNSQFAFRSSRIGRGSRERAPAGFLGDFGGGQRRAFTFASGHSCERSSRFGPEAPPCPSGYSATLPPFRRGFFVPLTLGVHRQRAFAWTCPGIGGFGHGSIGAQARHLACPCRRARHRSVCPLACSSRATTTRSDDGCPPGRSIRRRQIPPD